MTGYVIQTPYGQQVLQLPTGIVLTADLLQYIGQQIEKAQLLRISQKQSPIIKDTGQANSVHVIQSLSDIALEQFATRKAVDVDQFISPAPPSSTSSSHLLQSPPVVTTSGAVSVPSPVIIRTAALSSQISTLHGNEEMPILEVTQPTLTLPPPATLTQSLPHPPRPIILMPARSNTKFLTEPNTLLKVISTEDVINNGVAAKVVYVDTQTIKKPSCSLVDKDAINMEDITLDQLESFAKVLKQKRIELGYTQGDLGIMMGKMYSSDFSQTTISRFEALNLSFKNMCKLLPILKSWLRDIENVDATKMILPDSSEALESRRKKRTSIETKIRLLLEKNFQTNPKPTSDEILEISQLLSINKEVIRIWFCNRRQKEKRVHPTISTETLSLNYMDLTQQIHNNNNNSNADGGGGEGLTTLTPNSSEQRGTTAAFQVIPKRLGIIGGGAAKPYTNVNLCPKPLTSTVLVTEAQVVNAAVSADHISGSEIYVDFSNTTAEN